MKRYRNAGNYVRKEKVYILKSSSILVLSLFLSIQVPLTSFTHIMISPDAKFFSIVDGKPVPATKFERCVDPRTEEPLWEVAISNPEDLDRAVEAAQRALKTWGKSTLDERKAKLVKIAECLKENAEVLKDCLMKETGKTVCRGIHSAQEHSIN